MSKRILVLDDNPDVCKILHDRLQSLGFNVITAPPVVMAIDDPVVLAVLDDSRFDAVLLDLGLPTMVGCTVPRNLQDRHPHIPVLMMSVHEYRAELEQAMRDGARDYVLKPIDFGQLEEKVRRIFDQTKPE